jgi:hypothetical protein
MTTVEFMHLVREYGVGVALLVVGAVIGIGFVLHVLKKLVTRVTDSIVKIDKINTSLTSKEGDPVIQHELIADLFKEIIEHRGECATHQQAALEHYSDVKRLSSEEHWKNCDVSKCGFMQSLISDIEHISDRITALDSLLKDQGIEFRSSDDSIKKQIADLTRDILATMRVFRGGIE